MLQGPCPSAPSSARAAHMPTLEPRSLVPSRHRMLYNTRAPLLCSAVRSKPAPQYHSGLPHRPVPKGYFTPWHPFLPGYKSTPPPPPPPPAKDICVASPFLTPCVALSSGTCSQPEHPALSSGYLANTPYYAARYLAPLSPALQANASEPRSQASLSPAFQVHAPEPCSLAPLSRLGALLPGTTLTCLAGSCLGDLLPGPTHPPPFAGLGALLPLQTGLGPPLPPFAGLGAQLSLQTGLGAPLPTQTGLGAQLPPVCWPRSHASEPRTPAPLSPALQAHALEPRSLPPPLSPPFAGLGALLPPQTGLGPLFPPFAGLGAQLIPQTGLGAPLPTQTGLGAQPPPPPVCWPRSHASEPRSTAPLRPALQAHAPEPRSMALL